MLATAQSPRIREQAGGAANPPSSTGARIRDGREPASTGFSEQAACGGIRLPARLALGALSGEEAIQYAIDIGGTELHLAPSRGLVDGSCRRNPSASLQTGQRCSVRRCTCRNPPRRTARPNRCGAKHRIREQTLKYRSCFPPTSPKTRSSIRKQRPSDLAVPQPTGADLALDVPVKLFQTRPLRKSWNLVDVSP